MLGFYLSTVVIWMIIIYCSIFIFRDNLKEKVTPTYKKSLSSIWYLFVISAIPVFRLFVEIAIIYMALCTKEEYNALMDKSKNKNGKDVEQD